MPINTNYPMVLVIGRSGSGKSYSLKDLNLATTCVINIEQKPFPFRNKFPMEFQPSTVQEFDANLDTAILSNIIDVIVIESGSKYAEELLALAKRLNKGYDIYNYFNDRTATFLAKIKRNNRKVIVITWIDELVKEISPGGTESTTRRAGISGKVWEGKIEKEFAIVLFTDVRQEKGKEVEYRFMTNNDGTNSAKSPPDMFGKQYITNNLKFVTDKVFEYYELPRLSKASEEEKKAMIEGDKTIVLDSKI